MTQKTALKPLKFTFNDSSSDMVDYDSMSTLGRMMDDVHAAKVYEVTGDFADAVSRDIHALQDPDSKEIYVIVGCQVRSLAVWRRVAAKMVDDHNVGDDADGADSVPTLSDVPHEVTVGEGSWSGTGEYFVTLSETERKRILAEAIKLHADEYPLVSEGSPRDRVKLTLDAFFDAVEKKFAPKAKKTKKGKKTAKKKARR